MAESKSEISINRSADDTWKLLREFGGLAEWMPGVETCSLEGDVRTIGMMGISVKEQLRNLDDNARTISYSIVESPMDNLESHLATITVTPEGSGSRVTYECEAKPDELIGMFGPLYESSLTEIKKKLEG